MPYIFLGFYSSVSGDTSGAFGLLFNLWVGHMLIKALELRFKFANPCMGGAQGISITHSQSLAEPTRPP